MPILCSIELARTPLGAPSAPVAGSICRAGTMNTCTAARLAGTRPSSPGTLASTMCTMFSVRSWSPPEMKILRPEMRQLPSGCATARVASWRRSVPACGSVMHIVAVQSPSDRRGTTCRFTQSGPSAASMLAAGAQKLLYIEKEWPVDARSSVTGTAITGGSPAPPSAWARLSRCQPASR